MKIVLNVMGVVAGVFAVVFLAACVAIATAGKCMKAMEEM